MNIGMSDWRAAERLLEEANELLRDDAWVRINGYNRIEVLLRMAEIHLRLDRDLIP